MNMTRLHLVLDVDQTLIHCVHCQERPSGPGWQTLNLSASTSDVSNTSRYWFQIRPGAVPFLQTVRELFHLHVYSLGQRRYVEAIFSVLAPWLPVHDIWSRTDQKDELNKHLSRIGLNSTNTLIVDDCPDVWCTDDVTNVIAVKPYVHSHHETDRWLLRVVLPQLLTVLHDGPRNDMPLSAYLTRARSQTFAATSILFVTDDLCYTQCLAGDSLLVPYAPFGKLLYALHQSSRHGARCFLFAPRRPIREFGAPIVSRWNEHSSQSMDLQLSPMLPLVGDEWHSINTSTDNDTHDDDIDNASSLNSRTIMPGEFEWTDMTHAVFDPTQTVELPWEAVALHRTQSLHLAPLEWLYDSCHAWTEFCTDAYLHTHTLRTNVKISTC